MLVSLKSENNFENGENPLEKSAFVGCSTPGPFSCFHTIRLNPLLWVEMYVLTFQNVCLITVRMGQNLGSTLLLFPVGY